MASSLADVRHTEHGSLTVRRMRMFTRIVVPLDGSDLAEQALPQAVELAQATRTSMHLVRVLDFSYLAKLAGYPVHGAYVEMTAFQQALQDEHDDAGAYLKAKIGELEGEGITVTTALLSGNPAPEIAAATQDGDVIVMSTHGRGGLARWFLGSVAEGIVRRATVPVMLIRASEPSDESRLPIEPTPGMLI
jgi:nucleotide-binding universal stress UspA family protein